MSKVILVGEYGVGKSSLFRRFATDTFVTATDRASTLGLDNYGRIYSVSYELEVRRFNFLCPPCISEQIRDNKAIKLQLWDTGGMERVARSAPSKQF